MTDNALIPLEDNEIQQFSEKSFDELTRNNSGFFPRLQLMTSASEKCKVGDFPANHYAFVDGEDYKQLGKEVDVVVVLWRPKAISTGDPLIITHKKESALFQDIVERSSQPDSGCMYGPEFLVWVPEVKKFATFFMGSKSARNEAKPVLALLGKAATFSSKQAKSPKHTWMKPICKVCSTQITELPSPEDLADAKERFKNPPEPDIETTVESDSKERG